jgi:hypothetical protein
VYIASNGRITDKIGFGSGCGLTGIYLKRLRKTTEKPESGNGLN